MHWIKTSLIHLPTGKIMTVINVYMPTMYQEKIDCWSSLQNLQGNLELKDLIIAGDLNTTLHPKEKKRGFSSTGPHPRASRGSYILLPLTRHKAL